MTKKQFLESLPEITIELKVWELIAIGQLAVTGSEAHVYRGMPVAETGGKEIFDVSLPYLRRYDPKMDRLTMDTVADAKRLAPDETVKITIKPWHLLAFCVAIGPLGIMWSEQDKTVGAAVLRLMEIGVKETERIDREYEGGGKDQQVTMSSEMISRLLGQKLH